MHGGRGNKWRPHVVTTRQANELASLPPHETFYEDSFEWTTTPQRQSAERAYRRAFVKAAREAAKWAKVDNTVIDKAWKERRKVRETAEIRVPSAILFGDPSMDSEQIVYRPG